MGKKLEFICMALISLCITTGKVMADEVWLKNGDRITGKIERLENNSLILTTSYAGEITITWQEVSNLRTDESIKVIFDDGTSIQASISPGEEGRVTVKPNRLLKPGAVELAQFKTINPKPAEPPLKIKARVNFGANFTNGNTDTADIYGDGEFVAYTGKNRYTIGGSYQNSKDRDVTTADSVMGYMQYDYFLGKKWYLYGNATGEKDEFKDLNLRTSVGLGAGYQFILTDLTDLSLEGGLSYVNEDYIEALDNSYSAGRWAFQWDHDFLNKSLRFFHHHSGLVSLEDANDIVIYSQTGLRMPLYKHLNATTQFNYDYDNSPAPGREKADRTIIFSLGYQLGD